MKQAIVIRTDLDMEKGKIAAQACHASVAAFLKARKSEREKWLDEGMKKVVVKISGEKEMKTIFKKAKSGKFCRDNKRCWSYTTGARDCHGCWYRPADDAKIDKFTGRLKLL